MRFRLNAVIVLVTLAAFLGCAVATTSKADALITSLPGQDFVPSFQQYSGYITVDAKMGKNLFYWFQLSQNNPSTDPVVLWLNGGPGCSSIGGGAMEENGAYRPIFNVTNDGTKQVGVTYNPWTWNQAANVIFLDSPAGVGYSYSVDPTGLVTNVNITAEDSTAFLEIFFS